MTKSPCGLNTAASEEVQPHRLGQEACVILELVVQPIERAEFYS